MYGHTHSVERGILELKNGKSITLFLNGNGGSYPDYFGKYSTNIDYPEIHGIGVHRICYYRSRSCRKIISNDILRSLSTPTGQRGFINNVYSQI